MSLNNILLVTSREYFSRVKKKSFILITIFAPLAFIAFFVFMGFIMSKGSDDIKHIAVIDNAGLLGDSFKASDNLKFDISTKSVDELKKEYEEKNIDGILILPAIDDIRKKEFNLSYLSDKQLGIDEEFSITRKIKSHLRAHKIKSLELDSEKIAALDSDVKLNPSPILETDKKLTSLTNKVGVGLGVGISYLMFFIIMIYGSMVMRSVMEEKINRVVEVIISSVKPFELMMGKILGVGSVGLTQLAIWILLVSVAMPIVTSLFGFSAGGPMADLAGNSDVAQAAVNDNMGEIMEILREVMNINWALIIPLLIFYFFMGYFAYAAIFAALGSAVGEDINEAQSLTLPVMLPLIFAFYVAISAMTSVDKSLVVWSSMIPLTSSIVMPTRLPSGPPAWQIITSVVLLIAFVIFMVWLAGRIYRVGILMYGKKASFKELGKWVFYRV